MIGRVRTGLRKYWRDVETENVVLGTAMALLLVHWLGVVTALKLAVVLAFPWLFYWEVRYSAAG